MRREIEAKNLEAKTFAAELKDKQSTIELAIRQQLDIMGIDSFKAKGIGTAFKAEKDSVSVSDKENFKKFLAANMLMALQPSHYKTMEGNWQPDGEIDLDEHVETLLNSGSFDLLTVSANKLNCKKYMEENSGVMPDGVDYFKEIVIQFRKGK